MKHKYLQNNIPKGVYSKFLSKRRKMDIVIKNVIDDRQFVTSSSCSNLSNHTKKQMNLFEDLKNSFINFNKLSKTHRSRFANAKRFQCKKAKTCKYTMLHKSRSRLILDQFQNKTKDFISDEKYNVQNLSKDYSKYLKHSRSRYNSNLICQNNSKSDLKHYSIPESNISLSIKNIELLRHSLNKSKITHISKNSSSADNKREKLANFIKSLNSNKEKENQDLNPKLLINNINERNNKNLRKIKSCCFLDCRLLTSYPSTVIDSNIKTQENVKKSLLSLASLAHSLLKCSEMQSHLNANKASSTASKCKDCDSLNNQINQLSELSVNLKSKNSRKN